MQAAKEAKGGRLTEEEVNQHTAEFKRIWSSADQGVHHEAYQLWRQKPTNKDKPSNPEYALCWGGGCHATPFTPNELRDYIIECGWPSEEEALDGTHAERGVPADSTTDFEAVEYCDPWGVSRSARNAYRDGSRVPAAFDIIEKSMFNYLVSIGTGRDASDAADVMLIVEGPAVKGDTKRYVAMVTDITFSPHVFEVTDHVFEDSANLRSEGAGPTIFQGRPPPSDAPASRAPMGPDLGKGSRTLGVDA
eukprot:9485016-Pyramimonas_sp.AAC.1